MNQQAYNKLPENFVVILMAGKQFIGGLVAEVEGVGGGQVPVTSPDQALDMNLSEYRIAPAYQFEWRDTPTQVNGPRGPQMALVRQPFIMPVAELAGWDDFLDLPADAIVRPVKSLPDETQAMLSGLVEAYEKNKTARLRKKLVDSQSASPLVFGGGARKD